MSDQTNTTGEGTGSTSENATKSQAGFRAKLEDFEKTVRTKIEEADKMFRDAVRSAVPPEVTKHMNNSKREFLLGIRKMIDREIEKSDKQDHPTDTPQA